MTQPLAILLYEVLLPGSQLANRLRDLGYKVVTIHRLEELVGAVRQHKPLVGVVDLVSSKGDVCEALRQLRQDPEAGYLPVLAFADAQDARIHSAAREAGASLVAGSESVLSQFPLLLEQALRID